MAPRSSGRRRLRRDGVDGGRRYLPGEWPSESKLFDPDGAVTIYDTAPPEETPPDYPSPAG